jgi:O-acetyl-ADP-ribose deacetylase (regulator of RNase III)
MELQTRWNNADIYLHQGDITTLDVDALVNAAHDELRGGGGGVDAAIHRAGGPDIAKECQRIIKKLKGPLSIGQAVITTGGKLPARHVIHTVGPIYKREGRQAPELLATAYRSALAVARAFGLRSVAFPCISAGGYGYPAREACAIALATVKQELEQHDRLERTIFCVFGKTDYDIYLEEFRQMQTT